MVARRWADSLGCRAAVRYTSVGESKLGSFKQYLNQRLQAGVWSPPVLVRELGAQRRRRLRDPDGLAATAGANSAIAEQRSEMRAWASRPSGLGHLGSLSEGGQDASRGVSP
jgi:hypothetical protein